MTKIYKDITKRIASNIGQLNTNLPEVMQGFNSLAAAATEDGALDKKTKELIALGMGIVCRCDGCIGFHTKALIGLGVTKEEFEEVLGMSVYMGGGPALMYAAEAVQAYEEFSAK